MAVVGGRLGVHWGRCVHDSCRHVSVVVDGLVDVVGDLMVDRLVVDLMVDLMVDGLVVDGLVKGVVELGQRVVRRVRSCRHMVVADVRGVVDDRWLLEMRCREMCGGVDRGNREGGKVKERSLGYRRAQRASHQEHLK